MIIGISGKKSSGKNTVAKIINQLTNNKYEEKCFADKLKDIICLLINCTREQLEDASFKSKELGEEWWYFKGRNGSLISYSEGSKRSDEDLIKTTPRLLLPLLGTDCGRNIIHTNLWVLSLMNEYTGDVEEWKPIKEYEESYEVSSFGNIRSLDRTIVYGDKRGNYHNRKGQILKPTLSNGYETVSLRGKTFTVHYLVAKHFVTGYKEGYVVNHIDYNKNNNFYKNLEWVTQSDNILHNKTTLRGNFGEKQKDAKLTDEKVIAIKRLLEDGELNQKQISELFEVSAPTISGIKKGKKWNHVGKDIPTISPILPKPQPNWIISDVKFPNEVKAIKKKDGIVIRINRENAYNSTHSSETALDDYEDFDYTIDNNNCIDCLIEKVKEILKHEKII